MKNNLVHVLELSRKGQPPVILKEENIAVRLEDLLGDENGEVERGRSVRIALPFGEAAISSTTNIRITCEGTERTIKKAKIRIDKIIDKIAADDVGEMHKLLRAIEGRLHK